MATNLSIDPTAEFIHVQDERVTAPGPPPEPFIASERPALLWNITLADNKTVTDLPATFLSSPDLFRQLHENKALFANYTDQEFLEARNKTNPFEGLGRSVFMNRAGLKIANIDAIYKLTYHIGAYMSYTTPHSFKFADLAGAPGAFTQYIQWRRDAAMGYGISLKEESDDVPDWNLNYLDQSRFLPFYGDNGSGNLYYEWESFVNRVRSEQSPGLDLVVADGGFDVEATQAFQRQEFLSFRLIMVELLTSLKLLRVGGNCLIKMFATVTELTAQLLWIASLCFDQITLFKPIASRPANAEVYLICQGKRKNTERYEELLKEANASYNSEENVVNLIDTPLPADFIAWLTAINDQLITNQFAAVGRILAYLNREDPEIPLMNLHKALIVFNVPGPTIPRGSKIQIPGAGRGIPFSQGRSSETSK